LCEGTIAKFYDTSSLIPNLLLEGRVSYQNNRLVIEGIKYDKIPTGTNKVYGSFYIYNMDDYSMNYKPKKAGSLRIKCSKASYLEGFYLKCPVIVRLQGKNTVFVDGKTGTRGYSFLSAVIPSFTLNDDDSFDIYQILLQAKNDVIMCWDDGAAFKGRVKPTIGEDSAILFQTLDGQITGRISGPKMSISKAMANIESYIAAKKRLWPKNIRPILSLMEMTNPINGLCSTSITSPSIQSACAVNCGLTFILSPTFGSILSVSYFNSLQDNNYFE